MKRRKRKMRLHVMPATRSGGIDGTIRHTGGCGDRLGSQFVPLAVVCLIILHVAHLVNPTTQINAVRGNNQSSTMNTNHFDDEPNFQLEFVNLKRIVVPPSTVGTPQMISNDTASEPPSRQLITIIKPQDQLERPSESADDASPQHLDDLLAVESNRSPIAIGQAGQQLKQQQQSGFFAPYEANGALPRFQNLAASPSSAPIKHSKENTQVNSTSSTQPTGDNSSTQLMRLQSHHLAPLEPIYLKHNLPDNSQPPLKRGQIVAFPHPSHSRAPTNFASPAAQPQGSYALLPSWPNIYIAQRERTLTPAPPPPPPPPLDPKVPLNYPEWSLARARQRERENSSATNDGLPRQQVKLASHQDQGQTGRRTNLTASEVEYSELEDKESNSGTWTGKQKSVVTRGESQKADAFENSDENNNNKTTASADGAHWARMLHAAAAAAANSKQPLKPPLMFTNRSIISLFCDTHDMLINLKFKQPFYGFVETNLDPLRQCRIFGNGSHLYEMRISLLDCGTRQEMPRLFINNIHIQFRSNNSKQLQQRELVGPAPRRTDDEVQDDELKTLICSYPPPPPQALQPTLADSDEPASNSQLTAASNNLNFNNNHANDLTRPHSIAFGGGSRGPRNRVANRGSPNATGGLEINNQQDEFGRPLRPSDRIIDITGVDDPTSARPVYYEPILLISGLLLLALACTLALISSAYLARRRAQQRTSPRTTSNRLSPAGGADNRVYQISPSQLANRSGGSPLHHGLMTPPLIGLTKQELLTRRSSGKKYATTGQKELGVGAKHKQTATGSSVARKRLRPEVAAAAAVRDNTASRSSDGAASDSLASSGARGSQTESVSTIEIPLASAGRVTTRTPARQPKAPVTAESETGPTYDGAPVTTTREEYRREVSHERIVEKIVSRGSAGGGGGGPSSAEPQPPLAQRDKTPSEPVAHSSNNKKPQQEAKQSRSPPPFGSFRSRLTSPIEYMRLQNISKLFGDSLTPTRDDELHLRYRNRIARTMSDRERLDMRKLFQHDEVFKSNVVDSLDVVETFRRKLRDNPKYAGKFSPAAWSLLQEIMLNPDMARPPSTAARQSRLGVDSSTPKLDEIFNSPTTLTLSKGRTTSRESPSRESGGPRGQPKVTNLDDEEVKFWRPSDNVAVEQSRSPLDKQETKPLKSTYQPSPLLGLKPTARGAQPQPQPAETSAQRYAAAALKTDPGDKRLSSVKQMVSDRDGDRQTTKTTGVRISQSNSARTRRDDGSTMINIDSITNISTPRNFSAFTRSSFEQVTRYQEEDSLPYMDELSAQSSLRGRDLDQHSFSSSSLDDGTTRKSRRS